jgi:hypothetical protein
VTTPTNSPHHTTKISNSSATRTTLTDPVVGVKHDGQHLFRDLGDRYGEADTLTHLAETHHATGNPQAACGAWQQALTILDDLDHPNAEQVRAKLAGLDTATVEPDDGDADDDGERAGGT